MRGTVQNKIDKETSFNNEFDQFAGEPGEALVSVYNRFAQLMNDLERNGIKFPPVTVNTKFLNCLKPEWLKAKKLEKSHDPLALVAHTGSSSRTTSPYYVTHPSSVIDYDEDYQEDATNNHLGTSSNTKNQAIVQADRVHIQSRNSGNDGRNTRRSYVQEEVIEGTNVHNDAGNIQRTLRTTSSGTAANVQCYNCSEKDHYAQNCPKPRV
ncbi:gag-pol polyprotein [Tanacetum coccineum]